MLSGLICLSVNAQQSFKKDYFLKLSAGSMSFGSGDFMGYSILIDASKNVIKKSSFGMNRLLLGAELIFENGVKNPPIRSINSFNHVSSSILWPKASWFPLQKWGRGFNIQIGPTLGYSYRSMEGAKTISTNILGEWVRTSQILYDNGMTYGYRISTGFEFEISNKIITGLRVDWSNNNEAEINTLLGLKFGVKL